MSALALLLCASLAQAIEPIIVDNQDGAPTFTVTGDDWTTWETLGYGYDSGDTNYHYLSNTLGGSDRRGTATWTPDLPVAGVYNIAAWYRLTENRTNDADHYVTDGDGIITHTVLDQEGDGASGWVELGEYYCLAGSGGCSVTLDGTDDDESDEANAMRFLLVEAGEVEPEPEEDCSEDLGPGTHTLTFYPSSVSGSGGSDDWSSTSNAAGAPDGREASTPNVDAGEYLKTTVWDVCEPAGAVIDRVVIAVLGRLQYDSGQYALVMNLGAGGAATTTWSYTTAAWTYLDVTDDRGGWSFSDLSSLQASVTLNSQPGGYRDSDAWVDAFEMTVTYTVEDTSEPEDTGDRGVDSAAPDTDGAPSDTDAGPAGPGPGDGGDPGPGPGTDEGLVDTASAEGGDEKGCGVVPAGSSAPASGWALLSVMVGGLIRRRRDRLSQWAPPTKSI